MSSSITSSEEDAWFETMKAILNETEFAEVDFVLPGRDPDEENFKMIIALLVITSAIMGLLTNFFVLLLSMFQIKGDYRHYIANLALVDILCALLFAFMGYLNLDPRWASKYFGHRIMSYSAFAFYGSFGVMICALVPVSLSRVVAASMPKSYEKLFSGRRSMFICFLFDMMPFALLAVICIARHDHARWLFFVYVFLTFGAYVVTFVSNSLVFRIVASHIRVVQSLHDRTRLLETRQVAIATLAQAVVPLVCQVPAFLTLSGTLLLIQPIIDEKIIVITQLWLAASPLFDALITMFVIKQYRIKTVTFWTKIFHSKCFSRKRSTGYIQASTKEEILEEHL